jgi:hypothetical protein
MATRTSASPVVEAIKSTTAWFAVLERARIDNDFTRAAEAVQQLRQLGVEVRFVRQPVAEAQRV